jgi:hypothetical protein
MARYNDIKIITHRTLYACLTHTIATVELHHIISSTIQCVNCQLSVSIGRPYTNETNISNVIIVYQTTFIQYCIDM